MARFDAQHWYDILAGDPLVEYISPEDAKSSVAQIYEDMVGVIQVGNGANGQLNHIYIPDKTSGDVDPDSFVGPNPAGWVDLGPTGGSVNAGNLAVHIGPRTPVPDPSSYDFWIVTP